MSVTSDQIRAATMLYVAGWSFDRIAGVMGLEPADLGPRVRGHFAAVRKLRPVNRRRPLDPVAEREEARKLREIRA